MSRFIESVQWWVKDLILYSFLSGLLVVKAERGTNAEEVKRESKGRSDAVSRCMCVIAEWGIGHSPSTML